MPYALGIDLGTTSTVAAVAHWHGTGWARPQVVPLGGRSAAMPSTLRVGADGPAAGVDGDGPDIARGFLHRIGDSVSMSVDGGPHRATELTARLVERVVDRVGAAYGEAPDQVALAVPAHWGGYRTGRLRAALTRLGLDRVALVPAAVAAVHAHAAELDIPVDGTIAVYALGHTGCTCTLLRREVAGFSVVASGSTPVGGADLDDVLIDRVRGGAAGRYPRAVWTALRERCVAAREELSTEKSVTIRVPVPGAPPTVTVTCAEFEELILPVLTATGDLLRAVLRAGPDATAVVLAGGVTHIPLVRRLVESTASVPVLIAATPEHTIAVGAAAAAGEATSAPEPAAGERAAALDLAALDLAALDPAALDPAALDRPAEPAGFAYPPPRPPVLITELTAPRRRSRE